MTQPDTKQLYITLMKLRKDAYELGMRDLAVIYGWSAIRAGNELLVELGEKPIK